MNDSIKRQIEKYNTKEELVAYANAQYKTILKLNKRIEKLEEELKDAQSVTFENDDLITNKFDFSVITDEEAICLMELNRLRQASMQAELTMEECRKVQTYVQTLATIRGKEHKAPKPTEKMSTEDLLKAMESLGDSSAN